MLILYATLLISALSAAISAEEPSTIDALSLTFVKSKRGIVEPNIDYEFRQSLDSNPRSASIALSQNEKPRRLSNRQVQPDAQRVSQVGQNYGQTPFNGQAPSYESVLKQLSPYVDLPASVRLSESPEKNSQVAPYFGNGFTVSTGYKVANDAPQPRQINALGSQSNQKYPDFNYSPNHNNYNRNKEIGTRGNIQSSNIQVPVYRNTYPHPKAAGFSQTYAPTFQVASQTVPSFQSFGRLNQNGRYRDAADGKKVSLPVIQLENNLDPSVYLRSFQSQPLALSPATGHQTLPNFNYEVGTTKTNAIQSAAPFLSPVSSFQGQVVPIQTPGSSPQFPQYKGASIQVYPSVAAPRTPSIYEPLRSQPHLNFANANHQGVQPVNPQTSTRNISPVQEIRSDVEIINKKKSTTTTPSSVDDEDDEDFEDGYRNIEKEYGPGSEENDDFEHTSGKYFQEPPVEGDFKPSKSFPFEQYDNMFGKYPRQKFEEESEEKPFPKYQDYSSSSDDDDDEGEEIESAKFQSDGPSTGPTYGRYLEEEEEDGNGSKLERQQKEYPDYSIKSQPYRYRDKDFEEEFDSSYRKELPKQRRVHVKEVPELQYKSSLRRQKDNGRFFKNESAEPSSQGSRTNYKYHKSQKP